MSIQLNSFYRRRLSEELVSRIKRNPRYSVRAFAKALDLDAGTLSRILSGKQIPSAQICDRILGKLLLPPSERRTFLSSVSETQGARNLKRTRPFPVITDDFVQDELSQDVFACMSDWYHIAILELTFVKGFKSDTKWISRRLGISDAEVKLAVDRLLRLGLLKFDKARLTKSKRQLSTTNKSETSAALIRNQRQILEKANEALEKFPVQARSMTAMTMAIDPTKLEQARKLVSQFNKQMCQLLEDGEQTAVYTLEVALFPLENSLTEGPKT